MPLLIHLKCTAAAILLSFSLISCAQTGPFAPVYEQNCAPCHGKELQGAVGSALIGTELKHGDSVDELIASISEGMPEKGMPGFKTVLSESEIRGLAIYISELRKDQTMATFNFRKKLDISDEVIESEKQNFRLEVVAEDLDSWPYSIAPLPQGGFLLTEKMRGLSIISPDGEQSPLIEGLPEFSTPKEAGKDGLGLIHGLGWLLDVALHPDYEENGWIYLSYGDRCRECSEFSRTYPYPVSMLRLIRGRIENGQWVDQEVIWEVDNEMYTPSPETSLGGRICFDDQGHLFFSSGAKWYEPVPQGNMEAYHGIQDIALPFGKIHRIYDDGRIPQDNPFTDSVDAMQSIWTYGHRSPQGLEVDPATGDLWGTEMGPRGGDEVNYLRPGLNYGWPLVSKGVNYNGTPVEYGRYLEIEFDSSEIIQPVVDLTPAPAISSFAFCQDERYPGWTGDIIVGTLKATQLYRMEIENGTVVAQETLIDDLARIRDVEMGFDGYLYLLLEHTKGSKIVRIVPVEE